MAKLIWIINMDNTFISTAPHPEFTAVVHENIGIDRRANVLSMFLSITIHHEVIHECWLFDRDIDLAAVLAKPIHLFPKCAAIEKVTVQCHPINISNSCIPSQSDQCRPALSCHSIYPLHRTNSLLDTRCPPPHLYTNCNA